MTWNHKTSIELTIGREYQIKPVVIQLRVPKKIAVFTLTRGYSHISKWKYITLIRRNRSIKRVLKSRDIHADLLIFHEGNIGKVDQILIQLISSSRITFTDVGSDFALGKNQVWLKETNKQLGYSLMCRFNYYDVWKYLSGYEVVCRVDEDCLLINLPDFSSQSIFLCGAIHAETHETTNLTLPPVLTEMGLVHHYDHKFPYTNVYITKPSFWMQPEVQEFLQLFGEHAMAIENRWGDLPILGVALKHFGDWIADENICDEITYSHLSHQTEVRNGVIS